MINYENKAINLHAEVYGWLYRALDEMVKAEWHNDELFKVWLGRAEFLVRQSKKACADSFVVSNGVSAFTFSTSSLSGSFFDLLTQVNTEST